MIFNIPKESPSENPSDNLLRNLRKTHLFSKLSDDDLAVFSNAAQVRSFKKGKILYVQEDKADYFYVVTKGWIKLFHSMPDGEEVVIDMLSIGNMVGESAIFENGHHTSSAQVIEDVTTISLPSKILKEQVVLNPAVALGMLSAMFQHHRRNYDALALNAMQSAPQRIGCFMLRLCPPDTTKDIAFDFPYDKTLIATTLGMKGATFSRALGLLRKKTGIRVNGVRVEIDSVATLIKFVYGAYGTNLIPRDM